MKGYRAFEVGQKVIGAPGTLHEGEVGEVEWTRAGERGGSVRVRWTRGRGTLSSPASAFVASLPDCATCGGSRVVDCPSCEATSCACAASERCEGGCGSCGECESGDVPCGDCEGTGVQDG